MEENWAEYGYPDHIYFRLMRIPLLGAVNAINERLLAVDMKTIGVPDYFAEYPGSQEFIGKLEAVLKSSAAEYVNPGKVDTARYYYQCFWTYSDLLNAASPGGEIDKYWKDPFRPSFSVKWAIHFYNAVNLLRYVPTTKQEDWPDFEYTDKNNTFKFKA